MRVLVERTSVGQWAGQSVTTWRSDIVGRGGTAEVELEWVGGELTVDGVGHGGGFGERDGSHGGFVARCLSGRSVKCEV